MPGEIILKVKALLHLPFNLFLSPKIAEDIKQGFASFLRFPSDRWVQYLNLRALWKEKVTPMNKDLQKEILVSV